MEQDETLGSDDKLILLLATGSSITDAAAACDVSRTTVWRRMRSSTFRSKVQEYRTILSSEAAGKLMFYSADASEELFKLLKDESAAIRLRAAGTIVVLGMKIRVLDDYGQRLKIIEERLGVNA